MIVTVKKATRVSKTVPGTVVQSKGRKYMVVSLDTNVRAGVTGLFALDLETNEVTWYTSSESLDGWMGNKPHEVLGIAREIIVES